MLFCRILGPSIPRSPRFCSSCALRAVLANRTQALLQLAKASGKDVSEGAAVVLAPSASSCCLLAFSQQAFGARTAEQAEVLQALGP
eukprot:2929534-Alexandrium_andersonii.AAC.1